MIEVAFTSGFLRKLKRVVHNNAARRKRFEQALLTFVNDPFTESLRTHKLSGKLNDHWSFTVEYDLRVIFSFVEVNKALFKDIGSHKEVY